MILNIMLVEKGIWTKEAKGKWLEFETEDRYVIPINLKDYDTEFLKNLEKEFDFDKNLSLDREQNLAINIVRDMYRDNEIYPDSDCPFIISNKNSAWWDRSEINYDFFPIEEWDKDNGNVDFLSSSLYWKLLKTDKEGKAIVEYE